MWQLRRDLTDYSLQSAARLASAFSQDISKDIANIDYRAINQFWKPLSARISDLMNAIEKSKLKSLTSVADRVADFQSDINDGLSYFLANKDENSFNVVVSFSEDLTGVYREFLTDFLVTEEYAQYALSETDSLIINISDNNFYTPRDHLPYVMSFDDSASLRIEDPTLLEELRTMASKEADQMSRLPFMSAFDNYQKNIDSLKSFYPQIKAKYRRNIDITIKNKEIESVLEEIPNSAVYDAYLKMKSFVEEVPQSNSYSGIKESTEEALLSLGAFKQVYAENFFGNLDTVHTELIAQLNDYNRILSDIRRNTFSFDGHIQSLNKALAEIKSMSSNSVVPDLEKIEVNMKNVYLFASEGKNESVYGIFSTRIVNHGKISGPTGQKSWEE